MCLAVLACLDRYLSLWNSLPALVRRRAELGNKLELIQVITEEQERDRTGVTVDKKRMAVLLVEGMLGVAGPMRALAADRRDANLRQRSAIVRSTLLQLPQGRLAEQAKSLHALALEHREEAADYGLSQELLDQLENRRIAYHSMVLAPRNNAVERAKMTKVLDRELRGVTESLKEFFDPIVEGLAETQPDFHGEYRIARTLVKAPVRRKRTDAGQGATRSVTRAEDSNGSDAAAPVELAN